MRGSDERTGSLFSYVDLEDRVPAKHPLRVIRCIVNDVLATLDGEFAEIYADSGRLSVPPERLLRAFALRWGSIIVDGEAVCCGEDGVSSFDGIRYRRNDSGVFLYAFDLIELDGDDLRREPLAVRKATLASVLARAAPGLRLCEHLDYEDGETVFRHACKMGLEGIVSKRRDSPYRSGRSPDWLKCKNPDSPAVRREDEEEWGR
jgi:ATP-dependent DNA ligase